MLINDYVAKMMACLLLDRFADYGSDRAVAPVRESVAQALGVLVGERSRQRQSGDLTQRVLDVLLALAKFDDHGSPTWTVRNAGLLGLKYVMAAISSNVISGGYAVQLVEVVTQT